MTSDTQVWWCRSVIWTVQHITAGGSQVEGHPGPFSETFSPNRSERAWKCSSVIDLFPGLCPRCGKIQNKEGGVPSHAHRMGPPRAAKSLGLRQPWCGMAVIPSHLSSALGCTFNLPCLCFTLQTLTQPTSGHTKGTGSSQLKSIQERAQNAPVWLWLSHDHCDRQAGVTSERSQVCFLRALEFFWPLPLLHYRAGAIFRSLEVPTPIHNNAKARPLPL